MEYYTVVKTNDLTCINMNKTLKNNVRKKATEEYIQHDTIYIKVQKQVNLSNNITRDT